MVQIAIENQHEKLSLFKNHIIHSAVIQTGAMLYHPAERIASFNALKIDENLIEEDAGVENPFQPRKEDCVDAGPVISDLKTGKMRADEPLFLWIGELALPTISMD